LLKSLPALPHLTTGVTDWAMLALRTQKYRLGKQTKKSTDLELPNGGGTYLSTVKVNTKMHSIQHLSF
jgi:hypothetical protein